MQGIGGFGSLGGCWVHHFSRIDEMVIPHCNCAQKEWEVVHLCGLHAIELSNKKRIHTLSHSLMKLWIQ
jgi:hypothetical protein